MDSFLGNCLRDHWDQRRGHNSQVHAKQRLVKFRAATASLRAPFGASAIANFLLSVSDRERLNRTESLVEFQSNWLANPRLVDMFVAPIPCSSMVERAAVNRQVTGSSPVGGVQTVGLSRGRPSCLQAGGQIAPRGASWRGLRALGFVERAEGSDPNGGQTADSPPRSHALSERVNSSLRSRGRSERWPSSFAGSQDRQSRSAARTPHPIGGSGGTSGQARETRADSKRARCAKHGRTISESLRQCSPGASANRFARHEFAL